MRIDVHAHYWTEDYLDLLADLGKTDTGIARGRLPARGRLHQRPQIDPGAARAILDQNASALLGLG